MYTFRKLKGKVTVAELISSSDYYGTVTARDLAGADMYGMLYNEKALVACVMVVRMGAQAYVDYLYVATGHRSKGLATELVTKVRDDLEKRGVHIVHACVSGENGTSMKMMQSLGAKIGWPFVNVSIRLGD